jgi:hypothetical protein
LTASTKKTNRRDNSMAKLWRYDELNDVWIKVSEDAPLPVVVDNSDIELGAVELKDATSDNRVAVDSSGRLTLTAGELHLGEVGGSSKIVSPTITVDTDAYTAGDCVGGKVTLTDAMRVIGGSGVLQSLTVIDVSNTKPALELLIFNSDPTAATLTDQAAIALSTDVSKVIHRIPIYTSDYTTVASVAFADINVSKVVEAVGSKNLYLAIAATGAHDFVAATDLKMSFGFLQD